MLNYGKMSRIERYKAIGELDKQYREMIGELTHEENEALGEYAAHKHTAINDLMRYPETAGEYGEVDRDLIASIHACIEVMKRSRLPQDTQLYRGMQFDREGHHSFGGELKPGHTWQEKSFVSTSWDFESAMEFANEWGDDYIEDPDNVQKVVLHLQTPKGMPSIHMNAMQNFSMMEEEEMLLAPSTWKAIQVREVDGITHVLATCESYDLDQKIDIVKEPVIKPGGHQRHTTSPVYYHTLTNCPHAHMPYKREPGDRTSPLAWIPETVHAKQIDKQFIVDGEEIEWGNAGDYIAQDPETGMGYTVEKQEFEEVYSEVEISQDISHQDIEL